MAITVAGWVSPIKTPASAGPSTLVAASSVNALEWHTLTGRLGVQTGAGFFDHEEDE